MNLATTALLFLLVGTNASPQPRATDTCASGFVWREAFPGDHVCVTPSARRQAARDNRAAARRRAPGGGAYGPDTCREGFVWREARPGDHVCVAPETRDQTAAENRAVAGRVTRPHIGPQPDIVADRQSVARTPERNLQKFAQPHLQQPHFQAPPRPPSGSAIKRGFDADGQPYIEETLSDGSVRRQQKKGVTVTKPDGSPPEFIPAMTLFSNVQPPTPPALPDDPRLGRGWVIFHNEQLLDLISLLVKGDASEMKKFSDAENQAVGSDLFRQVDYRTRVLEVLASP